MMVKELLELLNLLYCIVYALIFIHCYKIKTIKVFLHETVLTCLHLPLLYRFHIKPEICIIKCNMHVMWISK